MGTTHKRGDLGRGILHVGPLGLTLGRKGATHALEREGQKEGMCEWDKWVSVDSANARFTINSYLPSLFLKLVWYAACSKDIIANFRSIAWGIGAKRYPVEWWSPLLKKFLAKHKLDKLIPLPVFGRWVREGKG